MKMKFRFALCSVNRSTESFDSISIRFDKIDKRYNDEVT